MVTSGTPYTGPYIVPKVPVQQFLINCFMIKPTALKPRYTEKQNKYFQRNVKIESTELTLESNVKWKVETDIFPN